MPATCPSCNKFASLENNDPEIDDLEIDADGTVTASARLVRVSACCNDEMKETTFELSEELSEDLVAPHRGDGHELSVAEESSEVTERSDGKPGTPSRYRKTYFGVNLTVKVPCACEGKLIDKDGAIILPLDEEVSLQDETPASSFDEM